MFRPQRQHRYEVYRRSGFLPFEAMELSAIRFSEAPYLRAMIRDRAAIKAAFDKEADFNRWSQTRREAEYREVIKFEYLDHRWIRESRRELIGVPRYKASPWEMLNAYRQRAIDYGQYFPPPKKAVRRDIFGNVISIHISKGDVEGQKARRRAKIKASHGTPDYARYQRQRAEQKRRATERRRALEH